MDASRQPSPRPSPWYREPLVWMVLAIPASAVIVGVVMLVLANATWDGLVAGDYYQRGMQINRSLARDTEAARRGLEAVVSLPSPGVAEARITAGTDPAAVDGDRLTLRFARATRAGADVTVAMIRAPGSDAWRGDLPALPPGKWYVELGNEQWRLAAPVRIPTATGALVLRAQASEASGSR